MRVGFRSGRVVAWSSTWELGLLAVGWLGSWGCSPPPPKVEPAVSASTPEPPSEPPVVPTKEEIPSGKDCLKAQKLCAGGACDVTVQNQCDEPATCDAFVTAKCKAATQFLEAKGRKRATIPAKTDDKINVTAECSEGDVVYTDLTDLKCK